MSRSPRFHPWSLARGAGARRHADHRLGHHLLFAGADGAADRAERGWSLSFAMAAFRSPCWSRACLADVGRSIDRYGGHVVMTAGALVGALGLARWPMPRIRPPISRSGSCSARGRGRRSTIRPSPRSGASSAPRRAADHGADARRRIRLDRRLAGDAGRCSPASAGAAPISSMPRCWRWLRAASCLRAAAQPRRGATGL